MIDLRFAPKYQREFVYPDKKLTVIYRCSVKNATMTKVISELKQKETSAAGLYLSLFIITHIDF